MNLILASGSPRRSAILHKYGLDFSVIVSDVPEPGALRAEDAAMKNAVCKAKAVSAMNPDSLVLAADTVLEFEGGIIGKPKDSQDAFRILSRLSGRTHLVTTGVSIQCRNRKINICFAELSTVVFRKAGEAEIRRYMELVNVLDKAGAYALQEHPELLIESVDGDPENVIGLPFRAVEAVRNCLNLFSAAQ